MAAAALVAESEDNLNPFDQGELYEVRYIR